MNAVFNFLQHFQLQADFHSIVFCYEKLLLTRTSQLNVERRNKPIRSEKETYQKRSEANQKQGICPFDNLPFDVTKTRKSIQSMSPNCSKLLKCFVVKYHDY